MSLKRKPLWDTKLFDQFLSDRAKQPFAWGSNDCATFSADGIQVLTGVDIMADLRGYTTNVGAMQKIADVTGFKTLEDAVVWCAAKYALTERTHPLLTQRGDLVLYMNADGFIAAGLVHLNGRDVVSPGETGLLRMPLTSIYRVWTY